MFLGAQFLGAYVAFHLAGALNIEKDSHTCFNLDSWKDGIKEALAVCFFLWTYNHANKSDDVGIPKNLFLIAAIGASFSSTPLKYSATTECSPATSLFLTVE